MVIHIILHGADGHFIHFSEGTTKGRPQANSTHQSKMRPLLTILILFFIVLLIYCNNDTEGGNHPVRPPGDSVEVDSSRVDSAK